MSSHKILTLGALLIGVAAPLVAFGQFQPPTPEELSMTSDHKAPGAAAVYLYREEREDEQHHFRSVYARIKVLTEAGKDAATVQIRYQKNFIFYATGDNSSRFASGSATNWSAPDANHAGEDVRIDTNANAGHTDVSAIEGRVIHPDGTIVPLTGSPADLLQNKSGNSQVNQMTFNMPNVEVGSIIEYRYQIRYDRFQSAPDWQIQQPYFVHHAHYLFQPAPQFLPDHNIGGTSSAQASDSAIIDSHGNPMTDIRSVNILPPGAAVKTDGQGYYFVDLTDIPAIPVEKYAPNLRGQIYQVNFFYTDTPDAKDFWQAEMQAWMKEVNQYTAPTASIKRTVAEITSGLASPLDKAKKLYDMVQKFDNFDFAGNATPFSGTERIPAGSVDKVLERKAGTGYELTFLYLAMAKAAGLEARPERIASRTNRTFSAQLMDASQLDSMIVGLTIDGKEISLDPGQKFAPFGTVLWSHSGAGGVTMASNGKVEIVITPLQLNTDNKTVRVGTLTVSPDGTVSGKLQVAFVGQDALLWRQTALRTDANSVKEQIEKLIAAGVPDGIQAHVDGVAALTDPDKPLIAVVPITGSLADHTRGHLVLPRLFFETKETNPFPTDTSRVLPVDMHYPAQETEKITYDFPPGFSLDGTPQDASLKWESNAAYQLVSKSTANSITTARLLARGFTLLDASDYVKLRDFYDKVATTDRQQVVLVGAQASGK